MSKTSTVRARIQPKLKAHVEAVFHRLGLNATQAITLFYKQVELREGLPFEVALPTSTTKRTFESTDAGRDLIVTKTWTICSRSWESDVHPGLHEAV